METFNTLGQLDVEKAHALNWHKSIVTNFANMMACLLMRKHFVLPRPPVLLPACLVEMPFTVPHIWQKVVSLVLYAKIENMSNPRHR